VLPIGSVTFVPSNVRSKDPTRACLNSYRHSLKFLESIADAFIMTFGITPPRPERRRVAAIFIGSALFLTVAGVLALFTVAIVHLLMR
jgi:hypothetical protein